MDSTYAKTPPPAKCLVTLQNMLESVLLFGGRTHEAMIHDVYLHGVSSVEYDAVACSSLSHSHAWPGALDIN